MYPVFQVPAGDVLPVFFSTYGGTNGESITATGLAVTDIEIYKDGSTTQRASDAGYTLLDTDGLDFDALTGIHGFSIDTGDNTDSGFYTVGSWFTVVVSAITVDTQTVSFIACQFRLMAGESVAGVPEVDLTHVAGATTDVSALATNVAAILVDTGTTLQAELDGIQADTEDIQARLPAALVGGRIDATVDGTGMEAGAVTAIRDGIVLRTTLRGTATTGGTTTSIPTSAMSPATSVADQLKGRIVIFDHDTTTAALRGQATDITASSASATPTLTVTALTTAPASGDTFTVV
jgi:hypothetical protein